MVARDLGGFGAAVELAVGRPVVPLVRAAGDFVTWAERAGGRDVVVVADRRTGEETSRLTLSGDLEALDVQADGKVAVATALTRTETAIAWSAPRRSGLREVARGTRFGDVRVAGDRIAYVRQVGIADELAVTDLDGFSAPASFPVAGVEAFDFDGRRLSFATSRCLYAERVPGLTVRAAPPAGGPCARTEPILRPGAQAALSVRHPRLRVRVGCPMATSAGCPVAVRLVVWRGASPTVVAARRVRVARGAIPAITLRLSRRDVDVLRHRDPGPATVELQPLDAGRGAVVQAPLTLTAPARDRSRPRGGADGEFVIGSVRGDSPR
ncbi:MAG TPA: hypothetical protein VF533_04105 [Solirubrobacteraceae bacterium]